jgi:hypothetical protein
MAFERHLLGTDFKIVGMIMIAPTLGLAIYLTIRLRGERTELLHSAAVCAWICANSVWMTGEFFFDDGLRPFAVAFFVIGLLLVGCDYLMQAFEKQNV